MKLSIFLLVFGLAAASASNSADGPGTPRPVAALAGAGDPTTSNDAVELDVLRHMTQRRLDALLHNPRAGQARHVLGLEIALVLIDRGEYVKAPGADWHNNSDPTSATKLTVVGPRNFYMKYALAEFPEFQGLLGVAESTPLEPSELERISARVQGTIDTLFDE